MKFEIREIFIPLRFAYGHAAKKHKGVSSIICIAYANNGNVGLGEAVPRDYVTGETCESVIAALKKLIPEVMVKPMSMRRFRDNLLSMSGSWKGPFPSCAFCAVEGAVLDLAAREFETPLFSLFGDKTKDPLVYSGSIGISGRMKLIPKLLAYKAAGMMEYKVKVGDGNEIPRIGLIRKILGEEVRLFADANAAWEREDAIRKIEELSEHGIWAIEEPLRPVSAGNCLDGQLDREEVLDHGHYENYAWLKQRSPIPLIADESLISPGSLQKIVEHKSFDILNVRLSKCGGFTISSRMLESARENSLSFYQGAMVAESPILAAAGSHFGTLHGNHRLIQGHSHRALHKISFTSGGPVLKRGGLLTVGPEAGLGVSLNLKDLDKITKKMVKVEV